LKQKCTRLLLQRYREANITLGLDKFVFPAAEVRWAGYIVGENGISTDPAKLDAISQFPAPTNITELRRFMGMVEELSDFSSIISKAATPLRQLLSLSHDFVWTSDHDLAFNHVKEALTSPPILKQFDPNLETALHTDASRQNGLGYALLPHHPEGWRLVQCRSRFVSDAESRHVMVELEMNSVVWALKACRLFLIGLQNFTVVVDHQALVPILNKFTLDAVENPRLQRMKERISHFNFEAVWKKGSEHAIPDALSRAPVSTPTPGDIADDFCIHHHIQKIIRICVTDLNGDDTANPTASPDSVLEELRRVASLDANYLRLLLLIDDGFPTDSRSLEMFTRQFWKIRENLVVDDVLILFGHRLVIPMAVRKDVRQKINTAHQGINGTKRRALQTVY
jgi:hypothetical protein